MRDRLLFAVVGAMCLLTTTVYTQRRSTADPEIRTRLEQLFASWTDIDAAKAAPFFAKDSDLVFIDVGTEFHGWSDVVAQAPKLFADYRSLKLTLGDDLRTGGGGDTKWATASIRIELTKKDGDVERMGARYTAIFEKREKDWLIVHEHLSVPVGGTPQVSQR